LEKGGIKLQFTFEFKIYLMGKKKFGINEKVANARDKKETEKMSKKAAEAT
jgi:hypothetical protein